MTTAQAFLARHLPEEHPYLAVVHDSMRSGVCIVEPLGRAVSCDQLLTTYRHRAAHLTRFEARHPKQLREEVLQFCERLTASPGATAHWWVFKTPAPSTTTLLSNLALTNYSAP